MSSNKKAIIEYKPLQPGDVNSTHADVDDLISELGYKPSMPVEEGVRRFVEWYLEFIRR